MGGGGDSALGPTNHLPSIALLVGDAAFVNVVAGLCLLAVVGGLAFCFIRRRGCELRIGSLVFKVDAPGTGLAYSRVGAPSSVPVSAAKLTAAKPAQKGAIGADAIAEAEEETDDEDFDSEDFSPAASTTGMMRPGVAVRAVSV